MKKHYGGLSHDEKLETCIEENVLVQIENLRTHPAVLAALSCGTLQLHAWVYEIETGQVVAFDADAGQFVAVAEAGHGVAEGGDRLSARRPI
jgi:carbonic anhydrase